MGVLRRVAVIGAGPAGLFLARLLRRTLPNVIVDVHERNQRHDVAGFGVALSNRTMRRVAARDAVVGRALVTATRPLTAVEVRLPAGLQRYDGFPVAAVSRARLVDLLTDEAERAGVRLHHGREVRAEQLDADVVVLADGARSPHRAVLAEQFGTVVHTGAARYIWLGARADLGDAATMIFVPTAYGPMAAHVYAYGDGASTVVVELDDGTWRGAGLDRLTRPAGAPGEIGDEGLALLNDVFAPHLGAALVSNRSRWSRFEVVTNRRWSDGNRVLVGDAAHTAHFTVASGTSLALEDALALTAALATHDDSAAAFDAYERQRRGPVARVQRLAAGSMRWWETYGRRLRMPPAQFGLHFVTRTTAIGYLGLRRRCPGAVDEAEAAYRKESGMAAAETFGDAVATPLRTGRWRLPNRLVEFGDARSVAAPLRPAGLLRSPAHGWTVRAHGCLDVPGSGALEIVALAVPCPAAEEEVLAEVSGWATRWVDGVLLLPDHAVAGWWDRTCEFGGRVRTETGLVTIGCVPADWSVDPGRDPSGDPWPHRVQLALVSARLDLVAALPHTAAALAAPSTGE
ncbi:FAD-dependent monooxygenase [Micromonospora fulviviridis]|uniref:FAD-dependent monooxygenase n=1 Tax=Micromonospora fulviviridis TaxID=47860 RepID=UPI0037B27DFD